MGKANGKRHYEITSTKGHLNPRRTRRNLGPFSADNVIDIEGAELAHGRHMPVRIDMVH